MSTTASSPQVDGNVRSTVSSAAGKGGSIVTFWSECGAVIVSTFYFDFTKPRLKQFHLRQYMVIKTLYHVLRVNALYMPAKTVCDMSTT